MDVIDKEWVSHFIWLVLTNYSHILTNQFVEDGDFELIVGYKIKAGTPPHIISDFKQRINLLLNTAADNEIYRSCRIE